MMLLAPVRPPSRPGIDLRCASCTDVDWPAADLVIADPPWSYTRALRDVYGDLNPAERKAGKASIPRYTTGSPDDYYTTLPVAEIASSLERIPARRLALWLTWPLLAEWTGATHIDGRWWAWKHPVSGGAWTKSAEGDAGHFGPGHHWAGCSEPVLVYTRSPHTDRSVPLRNAWVEPPGLHSRKPAAWQAQWIRRWVPEGGLVLDPFAGLGSVAEAVLLAGGGRRYLGTEIDPERHQQAMSLIAQVRA